MSDGTKIEWTDATVNAVNGCSVVSPGCTNCYAMRLAGTRMKHHPSRAGLTNDTKAGPVWNGTIHVNEKAMIEPLSWAKPRKIFWNAHGDPFHPNVSDEVIDRCFVVMALTPHHIHQVLTKRPDRAREYLSRPSIFDDFDRATAAVNFVMRESGRNWGRCGSTSTHITTITRASGAREPGMLRRRDDGGVERLWFNEDKSERWHRCSDAYAATVPPWGAHEKEFGWGFKQWPLPNVWLGTSVEDQTRADERIPHLLATPAAVRFLSCEPLLGPVDLATIRLRRDGQMPTALSSQLGDYVRPLSGNFSDSPRIGWVIAGGESGPGARPMHLDWVRSLRDQCARTGTPFFFKQWGAHLPAGQIAAQTGLWNPLCGSSLLTTKKNAGRLLDGVEHNGMPA